jgi:hypothetical protein
VQQLQGSQRLGHGIERRLNAAFATSAPMPVAQLPLGFLFLDVALSGNNTSIKALVAGVV